MYKIRLSFHCAKEIRVIRAAIRDLSHARAKRVICEDWALKEWPLSCFYGKHVNMGINMGRSWRTFKTGPQLPDNFMEDDIEYTFGLSQTYFSRRLRSHEVGKLVSRGRCVQEW